ncbi:H/ACA ribonucleoprotein complex subunit 3-like [Echinops telfairi]|uniref:H/ACA ribonucleoprotein complex subunit 3-like n=1 Tax=Echinops telfairi TaxID=9371 RepID=A0AC55DSU2_ECHTE|nr:H/ACA ribonucleoprotein complex subunit 3-like [Echinops telfairi]
MFPQYYLNKEGDRVYTLKKLHPLGWQTCSVHPARFSPENKYLRYRITIKKCFRVLMTQQLHPVLRLPLMFLLPPADRSETSVTKLRSV